jgi:hypothetical protein
MALPSIHSEPERGQLRKILRKKLPPATSGTYPPGLNTQPRRVRSYTLSEATVRKQEAEFSPSPPQNPQNRHTWDDDDEESFVPFVTVTSPRSSPKKSPKTSPKKAEKQAASPSKKSGEDKEKNPFATSLHADAIKAIIQCVAASPPQSDCDVDLFKVKYTSTMRGNSVEARQAITECMTACKRSNEASCLTD